MSETIPDEGVLIIGQEHPFKQNETWLIKNFGIGSSIDYKKFGNTYIFSRDYKDLLPKNEKYSVCTFKKKHLTHAHHYTELKIIPIGSLRLVEQNRAKNLEEQGVVKIVWKHK